MVGGLVVPEGDAAFCRCWSRRALMDFGGDEEEEWVERAGEAAAASGWLTECSDLDLWMLVDLVGRFAGCVPLAEFLLVSWLPPGPCTFCCVGCWWDEGVGCGGVWEGVEGEVQSLKSYWWKAKQQKGEL